MINNNKTSNQKTILKKVSTALIIVGMIIFVIGFMLQFGSIVLMAGGDSFKEPPNFFIVILSGFALLFSGIMVGAVDSMRNAKNIQDDVTSIVRNRIMDVVSGRMQQPAQTYCKYCGSLLHENERECPNCGAGKTKD